MDLENENQQETSLGTSENISENPLSSAQESMNIEDSIEPAQESETVAEETASKLASGDLSVDLACATTVDNPTEPSPTPTNNVETDPKSPSTFREEQTNVNSENSPESNSSEGSRREISLTLGDGGEQFEDQGDSGLSYSPGEKVISSGGGVETLQEKDNVCIQSPIEKTVDSESIDPELTDVRECVEDNNQTTESIVDSNCSNVFDSNVLCKDVQSTAKNTITDLTSDVQQIVEESESVDNVSCSSSDKVIGSGDGNIIGGEECQGKDNVSRPSQSQSPIMKTLDVGGADPETNEDVQEANEETGLFSVANNILSKKDYGDGGDNNSYSNSFIDTSIFPKPPNASDSIVVANCFELDVIPKPDSLSDSVPSDGFPSSSFDTRDAFNIGADNASGFPGPSDDREDISDEELDLESSNIVKQVHDESNPALSLISDHPGSLNSKADNISMNSSDVGDIIDLKFEDAAIKSIGSSCDKVSNEDLEAVSDDELPTAPHVADIIPDPNTTTSLLDDREEVSSSEDEELDRPPQNLDATPISSEDELPMHNEEKPTDVDSEKVFDDLTPQSDSHSTRLESLEAEPISDEEDNNIVSEEPEPSKQETSFDEGEAGEIKSPALGSPISEQGDLMLGEVEPVSADESADTDGELPSGDEAEKEESQHKVGMDKNFESIDSDEDIPGDGHRSEQSSPVRKEGKESTKMSEEMMKPSEDMEAISDEENLDGGDDFVKKDGTIAKSTTKSSEDIQNLLEKGHIPTSFNEHQVELDYEEGYGEEGGADSKAELKEDESKAELKQEDGEDGECEDQGLASDKDEGELSDDDCEEGEIKEPGHRKMFVKPICRFFQRGHCTWGVSCRFLHPGVNDKGNYQMIEVPGFKPVVGVHARLGVPGQYPEQQQPPPPEEVEELPPPPMPDVPHVETAWERGLRIAKEQRKKASERKEKEPDFEEKRLNLSVEEDRELNKENEQRTTPRIIPKDPYYDQQAFEVDEYYKIPRDPWHTGHYENFEVRHHYPENSYSPPPSYREKPPQPPPMRSPMRSPMRYTRPLSPPIDKFGRHREERPPPPEREPMRVSDYPPPSAPKHPDEWVDPWQRAKSPKQQQSKQRSRSRGRRSRRSLSDSSDSSRSSRSSSGSSRSSRSGSSSSSSRSRSPEPAPPGVDRTDRHDRYGGDGPRSQVSVRGYDNNRGGFNNRYSNNLRYNNRGGYQGGYNSNRGGGGRNPYNSRPDSYQDGRMNRGGYNNNNYRGFRGRGGGGGGGYDNRGDPRNRYGGRNFSPSRGGRGPTPDRPLPYTRPRPKSRSSSRSSSSRSRSRSRSKSSDSSRSRSSSNSSSSRSSSSSSGGSADSDHLYRDLGSPGKAGRRPSSKKRPGVDSRKDSRTTKGNHHPSSASRHQPPPTGVDRAAPPPHSRSPPHPKYSQIPLPPPSSGGRSDTKYASRNAPQPPVKAKDPLKVVGQKSNIKLTLLPKQQQQTLGDRPNPLASPPHKRRLSDRDGSPLSPPPTKRLNLSMQASSLRMAADKASKLGMRPEKAKSPPAGSLPPPPPSSSASSMSAQRSKNNPLPAPTSPQRQTQGKSSSSSRPPAEASAKPASKAPTGVPPPSNPSSGQPAKAKKSMSSRREELLKQLKAVEDAIARKKFKMS